MIPAIIYTKLEELKVRHPESVNDFAAMKIILQTIDARTLDEIKQALLNAGK